MRLRRRGDAYSLTYKCDRGSEREEREVELARAQFDVLWPATEGRRLSKIRYDVAQGDRLIEIDVYTGRHEGVVVAEVEFTDEASCREFVPPDWLGDEVSGNPRYSNIVMAQQ